MSYFPEDIPFMSKEELRENGIRIPKDATDTNVGDTISRQAALEKVRAMQTYKLFMGDDMILVDKAEVQTELMMLPSVQPVAIDTNVGDTISRQAAIDALDCISGVEEVLRSLPTIQPQSTTGQLNDGVRSTARSTDLIDRGQAIEKFTMTAPQMSVIRIYEAVEILESMPTIQPVATDTNVGDTISKTDAVEHLRRVLGATVPITDYDEGFVDGVEFGVSTVSTMPTIQPEVLACGNGELVAKPEPHWIPVSERLPEDYTDVLVWFEYFRYGDYNCLYRTHGIGTYAAEYNSWMINHESGWKDLRVIAWMPLPEPYQKGAKD